MAELGYEQEELEAVLLEVLWLTVENYDPNRGATFNTCFWEYVRNRVIDLKKSAFRQKRSVRLYCESLDVDAFRTAVEQITEHPSAEDEVLAKLSVVERYR